MTAPSASARTCSADGDGQGRVERPRNRPAPAAGAYRPRRSGPQSLDVGLDRDDGERGGVRVHHRHRIGIRGRALRSTQVHCTRSRRDGDEIGLDRGWLACA